ncbi:MAG: PA0069 family radical SAM protein [Planctomycetota bacterium]
MRHGSRIDPPNRFEAIHTESELGHLEWDSEYLNAREKRTIEYVFDDSKSIVAKNESPDLPFRYSVNPYRGCIHGCSYCYARPGHEFLGFNAGLEFETKIVVKRDAPKLFKSFLARDAWCPEPIAFSGVTDCYQPAEREFQLTRGCLTVAADCRQPISIVTKNALIVRDIEILKRLARDDLVHVFISITTLDAELARAMEPRTSIPSARLRALRLLAEADIPVGVMVAPMIPGLNDSDMNNVLEAASKAGATSAGYVLLRLPLTVEPVFREWLQRTQPLKAERVLGRIRETRDGEMNSSQFGQRMVGKGELAEQIRKMFQLFKRKHGLDRLLPPHNCERFQPPIAEDGQQRLF